MKLKARVCIFILSLVIFLSGCEAFVRKFTRKPKNDKIQKEEVVLAPEEYAGKSLSSEELYRQYFLYWKSWQDELLSSLSSVGENQKKQLSCVEQALTNLAELRPLLQSQKQALLDTYINQLRQVQDAIVGDPYARSIMGTRQAAERIKRNILKDFSFPKIKDSLA
jgi:hypothetical protein